MAKKVNINYLQFLSKPERLDGIWSFKWTDPKTDQIESFSNKGKMIVLKKYSEILNYIKDFNKKSLKKDKKQDKIEVVKKGKKIKGNLTIKDSSIAVEGNNKAQTIAIKDRVLLLKVQGYANEDIKAKVSEEFKVSAGQVMESLSSTYEDLSKDITEEYIEICIYSHSLAYDDLYRKFQDLGYDKISIRALKAKEVLNNIGQDVFSLQINNIFDKDSTSSYVSSQLNALELKEMRQIFGKIQVHEI